MPVTDKLMMVAVAVSDMPTAQAFYSDKLGLKIIQDYRQDDNHWWVALTLPESGVTITLTTFHENVIPGAMKLWFGSSDITTAHKELDGKGVKVSDIQNDLHGPGSGVKWFNCTDPEGNQVIFEQA